MSKHLRKAKSEASRNIAGFNQTNPASFDDQKKEDDVVYIYLLHFHESISHARHYIGSTIDITKRMEQHATGNGAKITQELHRLGIGFTLARCWKATTRAAEKAFKTQANGPRFCPECSPRKFQKTLHKMESISRAVLQRSGIKTEYKGSKS